MPSLIINGAAMGPARPRIWERPRSCIETSTAKTSTIIRYHIPNEAEIASFPTKEMYLPILICKFYACVRKTHRDEEVT